MESACTLDMTLVFLWKAYVVQESGQMKIVVGQHHVHLDRLNTCCTSYPAARPERNKPPLRLTRGDEEEDGKSVSSPSVEVQTSLVTYSLSHPQQTSHRFRRGLCVVPVSLVLQNQCGRDLHVVVDTSKTPESLGSGAGPLPDSSSSAHPAPTAIASPVRWVGLTQASFTLARGQNTTVKLKAGFSSPGTFNLNKLSVFVSYSHHHHQMILQRHGTPSIITIVDAS